MGQTRVYDPATKGRKIVDPDGGKPPPSRAPDIPTPQPGLGDVSRRVAAERAASRPLPSRDISSNVRGGKQIGLARARKMSR
jgi:hypothetical protein